MSARVILFDIDGVLIQPGGYRAAYHQTVHHFLAQMGLEDLTPDDSVPELFESFGVTSEWDMVPVTLAIVLDAVFENQPDNRRFTKLDEAISWVKNQNLSSIGVDFESSINRLGPVLASGGMPAEALLRTCRDGSAALLPGLKDHLNLETLLGGSRDILRSQTTRVFQNYVLGEKAFQSAYGVEPLVSTPSCLEQFDLPAIDDSARDFIQRAIAAQELWVAAYTARPSLPPREVRVDPGGQYSPEAEMALQLLGLGEIPLIGFGSLQYTAGFLGLTAEDLLKPAPVQALAGIAAAWTGQEWSSLVWAVETYWKEKGFNLPKPVDTTITLLGEIELNIFEDSPAGIRAGLKAAEILSGLGIDIRVRAWGIAANAYKVNSLQQTGARVFPDVNAALEQAFLKTNPSS